MVDRSSWWTSLPPSAAASLSEVWIPVGLPGFAGQAMSREDIERKFRGNVGKRWSKERTESTLRALWEPDMAGDVRALLANLRSA